MHSLPDDCLEQAAATQDRSALLAAMELMGPLPGSLNPLDSCMVDGDFQTTMTDFHDFTESLPSETIRSMNMISKLDHSYRTISKRVDDLTHQWSHLPPDVIAESRPDLASLRADISCAISRAVSYRRYSHAEACRLRENILRYQTRLRYIHNKLVAMRDNWWSNDDDVNRKLVTGAQPTVSQSQEPPNGNGGRDTTLRGPRVPQITVPGEVLAPYEVRYALRDNKPAPVEHSTPGKKASLRNKPAPAARPTASEEPSEDDPSIPDYLISDTINEARPLKPALPLAPLKSPLTTSTPARIKLLQTPKRKTDLPAREPASVKPTPNALLLSPASKKPPPLVVPSAPNPLAGTPEAPWLQLTPVELAKLRKRMKKNINWHPSDAMVARELRILGRGPHDFRAAKQRAEDEGRPWDPVLPAMEPDPETGVLRFPVGAISVDTRVEAPMPPRRSGETMKIEHDALGSQAAREAEASARNFQMLASKLMNTSGLVAQPANVSPLTLARKSATRSKRKREAAAEQNTANVPLEDSTQTKLGRPLKRVRTTRTELHAKPASVSIVLPHSQTPIPAPLPPGHQSKETTADNVSLAADVSAPACSPSKARSATVKATFPTTDAVAGNTTITTTSQVPLKPPHEPEMLISPKSRGSAEPSRRRESKRQSSVGLRSSSRAGTPTTKSITPELAGHSTGSRRPSLRNGKVPSNELSSSTIAMAHRPRRASSSRRTPAAEADSGVPAEAASKTSLTTGNPNARYKRPAPGVVSVTSNGSSAVGRRQAAPRRKARQRKKGHAAIAEPAIMEEIDDEGNVIDPNEPRYCICNRVSYGTMIQCENVNNCREEWFHLECVGLTSIPARTTKWYCLECRKMLNIGEKGEVSARGIKM